MNERPQPSPTPSTTDWLARDHTDVASDVPRHAHRRVRSLLLAVLALASAAMLTGCARGETTDRTPRAPASVVVDGEYSDKRFIDMMVPHHLMAIDMAEEALEKSDDEDIRTMSERIVRGQANEIEELMRVRQELYGSRQTPDEMHPDAMRNMGMGDHGSTSAPSDHGDGHGIAAGSSDEFDRKFLDDMLAHHAAAIQHASVALVHSDHKRLKIIAREIVDEQAREVGMMSKWRLDRWEHVL
jgi:uncharacterized protein (DUF305 family)